MKIKFLGTAAAEGWPAVFCNCENCKRATALGGKNIRTRAQILVNDDLLVDLPPDTYMHKMQYGLDLSKVGTLLVTHSHMDHFYPMELSMRGYCYAHDMQQADLHIFSNEAVKESFEQQSRFEPFADAVKNSLHWHVMQPFDTATCGKYEIYALKAQHTNPEKALFYLIKEGNKAFLQCNDTGYLYEENFAFLETLGIPLDVVALDCTCGSIKVGKTGTHMGAEDCKEIMEKMRGYAFIKPTTRFILTHFSHNGGWTHEQLSDFFLEVGGEVAYDGMEIEIV